MKKYGFEKHINGEEATGTRILAFPKVGHYVLLFGVNEDESGKWQWKRDYYGERPTRRQMKADIEALVNGLTDEKITGGYEWHGMPVWLSGENQFNFKAAYDLAFQTNGASLPERYKLGEDAEGKPVYHDFKDLAEFQDFYHGAIAYIQKCINEGWEMKDGVDYDELFGREAGWD